LRRASIIAFITAALAAAPLAADEQTVTPDPFELTLASAEFVAGLRSFSFHWFLSYDEVVEGREKLTYVQSGTNEMVRDVGFSVHTERDDTYRDYYFDGRTFTVSSPNENFYASTPFAGRFEALVEAVQRRADAILPMWSIMSRELPERFTGGAEGVAYMGLTLIDGRLAHHVAFAGEGGEDWQVWISTEAETPLPLMIVITDTTLQGWPQSRVVFTDWQLSLDADPARFNFIPDADDVPLAVPRLDAAAEGPQAGPAGAAAGGNPGQEERR
jgi:hypothetical protein